MAIVIKVFDLNCCFLLALSVFSLHLSLPGSELGSKQGKTLEYGRQSCIFFVTHSTTIDHIDHTRTLVHHH